jgi:hypothetical protein
MSLDQMNATSGFMTPHNLSGDSLWRDYGAFEGSYWRLSKRLLTAEA